MNQIIGRYKVLSKMGHQRNRKFGSVFLAEEISTTEKVIIKKVELLGANSTAIGQIRSEKEFSFDELGLPKVIDFIETSEEIYLVKNYQIGIPLDEFWNQLKRKDQLPFIKSFFVEFLKLLNHIHAKGIIHCDLKPSNILISKVENVIHVELIDFGLAIKRPLPDRKLIFPLGYAAPELLLNQLHLVDQTSDYFSIGILLYRLFCGEIPLKHSNPSVCTNLQLAHPVTDHDKLPHGMFDLISKLTVKPKFQTLPAKTSIEKLNELLIAAKQNRLQSTQEIEVLIEKIRMKKRFGLF